MFLYMFKPGCVLACIMHSCVYACMHVRMYACMHAWLHLVCAHECRCIYISFASVWIHVPLQVCYLLLVYLCAVHFDTFCLLCPVSYLEHACYYFVFPCNRCNKEHFELWTFWTSVPYPTMQHFITEMCTFMHISVTKWCSVGYLYDALWDLWGGPISAENLSSIFPGQFRLLHHLRELLELNL